MPRNENPVVPIEQLSLEDRLKEPGHSQEHWYHVAGAYAENRTILDVGAGTGSGLVTLRARGAKEVLGIDPLPAGPGVARIDVGLFRDLSFDIVTCFDVIEHVEDDSAFLSHLLRIARGLLFLSTPNWDVWHCRNAYHVREYAPAEMAALLNGIGSYACWTAGANRAEQPVHACSLDKTLASYCIMIRGAECSDTQWADALSQMPGAASAVSEQLSRYGKWSEEWTSEMRRVFSSAPSALQGFAAVASWLNDLVTGIDVSLVPAGRADPVMDCMRYGRATRQEQFKIINWVHETLRELA